MTKHDTFSPFGSKALHNIYTVCKKTWSMFYHSLILPELDKIQTIEELLCVKSGMISLPLLDVSQADFM